MHESDGHKATDLVADLVELFPEFEKEWQQDIEDVPWRPTLHSVWMSFAPYCKAYLESAKKRVLIKFCELINRHVAAGGQSENAVSTCLLEHASQIGIRQAIRSYLSKDARQELR